MGEGGIVNPRRALKSGGLAAAACVACCAAPILGALGVTAGLATLAGVFFGIAALVAVVVLGLAVIGTRDSRNHTHTDPVSARPVDVANPARRARTNR